MKKSILKVIFESFKKGYLEKINEKIISSLV
jgi:hypothetical protein